MQSSEFGRLLDGAIGFLSRYERRKVALVMDELAELLKISDATVERYKNLGQIPEPDSVRLLAEELTRRTPLGREWLRALLAAARYPEREAAQLVEHLCPAERSAPPAPHPRADVPPAEYAAFVMRPEVFGRVRESLGQNLPVVVLVGMGGNGKSSLAREVALCALGGRDGMPAFDYVAWVSDEARPGSTHLATVLDSVARRLGYPAYADLSLHTKREKVTDLLRTHRLLLILDNAETIGDGSLIDWLNQLPAPSKALLTTRSCPERVHGAIMELPGMTDAEAHELAQQRLRGLGLGHLGREPEALAPLIAVTRGNPKAITMALGLVKAEGRTLEEVTADLAAARGDLFADLFARAWGMLDGSARRLLLVAPFFPESASIEALGASADVDSQALRRALHQLAELSLLDVVREHLSRPPCYALHPLARAFALARLREDAVLEHGLRLRWRDFFRHFVRHHAVRPELAVPYWQTISVAELAPLDPERVNLFAVLEWADQADERGTIIEFMMLLVHYMERRALYGLREQYGRRASVAAMADGRLADAAILLIDALGWLFVEQGRLAEAEQAIAEGLALVAQMPEGDPQRPDLQALGETFLGRAALHRGDVATATAHNERALKIPCAPVIRSRVLWFAGELMYFQRRYPETLEFYQQTDLEALRYGGEYLRSSAGTVGLVHLAMGAIDQAEQVLRAFLLEIPSELAVQRVYAVYGLAFVALARSDRAEALQLAEEARDTIQRLRIQHRLEAQLEQLIAHIRGADDDSLFPPDLPMGLLVC